MSRVRVVTMRVSGAALLVPQLAYMAQVYGGRGGRRLVWACYHEHETALEAQACGVQHVATDSNRKAANGRDYLRASPPA